MSKVAQIARDLQLAEGKVLRYTVSTVTQPVEWSKVVNHIEWSDLPHSALEAKATFEGLSLLGLVKRVNQRDYTFTELGKKVVAYADKHGLWRTNSAGIPVTSRIN
jgi:hypothetical protein